MIIYCPCQLLRNTIPSFQYYSVRPTFSSILSCKKSFHSFVCLKKYPFHIHYLTETFCSSICQCVLYALIAHRFNSVFEVYFVFSLYPYVCVVAAISVSESHWKRNGLQFLFSPFGVWYKKFSGCVLSISSMLNH